jgi:8-oxo-dGTP pyrophosphatase MutT (NUDIX family)
MTEPIPSATLILLRDTPQGIETLLMKRHSQVKFLGGFWVFPGGAVELQDIVDDELLTARKAAVRETHEEAGVMIDENHLVPLSQWITPEGAPKRFATWFFLGKASHHGVQVDGQEMVDSIWITPKEAVNKHRQQEIDILPPTLVSLMALQVFNTVAQALDHFQPKKPLFFLPKSHFHEDKLVMLYQGDAGYEQHDVSNNSARHRCVHTPQGWQYINEVNI